MIDENEDWPDDDEAVPALDDDELDDDDEVGLDDEAEDDDA